MFRGLKKTIAVCLIGFGIGTIMVLLLPVTWWLVIIRNYCYSCRNYLAKLLGY